MYTYMHMYIYIYYICIYIYNFLSSGTSNFSPLGTRHLKLKKSSPELETLHLILIARTAQLTHIT